VRRLPIRVRLTLPFALAMALVLTAVGGFVYLRVGSTLLGAVDQGLAAQATEAQARLGDEEEPLLDRDAIDSASVAQVLSASGSVLRSSTTGLPPLVDADIRRLVLTGRTVRISGPVPGRQGEWRLHAVPAANGTVLVVGRPLSSRNESLDRLRHEFLFAAPAALLLATLAGYWLAGAALRPVDAMSREAEAIGARTPDRRLPVPPADDEIARLARTLNDMLDRLEAALQHERRFVSDASHELRTPLALLRTELELALRRERSHDELELAVRSASEETERLTRLAEDLLLIARSDQGSLPVRREAVEARTLLADVARRFDARAEQLGRRVAVEPGEDAVLDADPQRLEQALGNLVDNALTHGGGAVSLSVRVDGDRVELHVADEGTGFPDGFAERAFDRFSRADDARGRGGAGLGLAIVQSIATAHAGSAGVANREGGGADVWISLNRPGSSAG
jgi:signal transduction histidine kinase